ncbi:hypothetical protein ABEB36_005502 [Hypothenemus hampei]|uniref:Uncharacterized protein n=1 Tax=Hypothenemus hampei TaxID=57062 RepID=A0ABD1EZ13_HYPHA
MKIVISICAFLVLTFLIQNIDSNQHEKHLSRVRRYLAFPEGAVFSAVFCLTNIMGIPAGSEIFSLNINWGLIYELPNDTKPLLEAYKPAMKRRNRRELYSRVEKVLTSMGYDGRSCVLRSLCEAEQRFFKDDENLIHKILSLIFRFPQEPLLKQEPDVHHVYHYASYLGKNHENTVKMYDTATSKCAEIFKCPFSLIDVALGYHSPFDF